MAQDQIDSAVFIPHTLPMKKPSSPIENIIINELTPDKNFQKERGRRLLRVFLNRLRLKKYASITISRPDPTYRVAYLGNVITGWAKGDGCVEKPLATLWRNYTQSSRPDVRMQLTVSSGGLKATTKDHGLTEYWAHRLTTCAAPTQFPRLFCWVYRHEGRRLRHELRCHAVLCPSVNVAQQIEQQLKHALSLALAEFKRDKISRQNARLSLVNSVYDNPTMPRRKILLSTGSHNYRPPLERSKSAPKLTSIEEIIEEEDDEDNKAKNVYKKILRHYDSASALLDKRKLFIHKIHEHYQPPKTILPVDENVCDVNINEQEEDEEDDDDDDDDDNDNESENIKPVDDKSDEILDELMQSSLRNDLLESCERAWYTALGNIPDLIPPDSDEGSLSSGCESASIVTSDSDPVENEKIEKKKTDVDFRVGGCVLARVRSFERVHSDLIKYTNKNLLGDNEVSLIPVGESQSDFSSLKVFKKRNSNDNTNFNCNNANHNEEDREEGSEGENDSACSDESGYEEEDIVSSVANIVLV